MEGTGRELTTSSGGGTCKNVHTCKIMCMVNLLGVKILNQSKIRCDFFVYNIFDHKIQKF